MLLYNVTIGIDKQIEREWLLWIQENYIRGIMNTGLFVECKIYKVLTHDDETSVSYSIQCFALSIENVLRYLNEFAPKLVEIHHARFKDQHVAFNTLLEEL
jgi:hypothetical protein